ncbi:hypothetical protein CK203_081981 [Vitis vinifera]|uniref:Uncharacterized protein n=1 Tax=Vitis vinifera TaxID=29760 RepID=A0A438BW67_VITVI|nr:hypothetical protein CK203_081981 [Vitis vinifera]
MSKKNSLGILLMEYSFNRKRKNDNLNLFIKVNNMIVCQGCERHNAISLIPGHGAPLSQHHYTKCI